MIPGGMSEAARIAARLAAATTQAGERDEAGAR